MEIFRLFGSIFLKDEDVNKKLDAVDKKAGGVGLTFGDMAKKAAGVGLAIGTAAVAISGAMFSLASKTADAASEINDMSERTGLNTDRLQEMKYACGQVGVEFNSLTTATKGLTNFMADAADGGKKQSEAFAQLKIDINNTDGSLRSLDSMFPEVIGKLADMKNVTERNALANDIFGKSATEMIPLLNQGSEGIKALSDEAHRLGGVMDASAIQAGDKFGDTLDKLKTALSGVFAKVGVELIPIFQKLADWIINHMPEIQNVIETVFRVIGDVFGFFKDTIGNAITWVKGLVSSNSEQLDGMKGTFTEIFNSIKLIITTFIDAAKKFWQDHGEQIMAIASKYWEYIKAVFSTALNIIKDVLNIWSDIVTGNWSKLWEDLKKYVADIWQGIKNILAAAINVVLSIFGTDLSKVTGIVSGIFDSVKNIIGKITSFIDGVVSTVQGALRAIGILNDTKIADKSYKVTEIHETVNSSPTGTGGGASGGTSKSSGGSGGGKAFAEGTDYAPAGLALVGERGPELIDFKGGERVIPNNKLGGITLNVYADNPSDMQQAKRYGDAIINVLGKLGVEPA